MRPGIIFLLACFCLVLGSPGECMAECVECHKIDVGKATSKSVHDPYREEDCTSCHQEHGEKGELLFVELGNALCSSCHDFHDAEMTAAHKKLYVEKIPCISCHHPHASEKMSLLRPNIHRPLAYGGCEDCHRENGRLRATTTALLCYRCHEAKAFQGLTQHQPVAAGECTACHDPHGSAQDRLLVLPFTMERNAPFKKNTYALCFSCHSVSAFTVADREAETGFKNFTDNLHYLHVGKQQIQTQAVSERVGITCRNCHLPHASDKPHLVRESLDCGGGVQCLKLEYTLRDAVGTCSGGCHKDSLYYSKGEVPPARPLLNEAARELPAAEISECIVCHRESWAKFQKKVMHDPVRKKRCEDCHLAHGLDNRLMLVAYEGRLCYRCHEERSKEMKDAHDGYEVSGSRCVRCHDPHASDARGLLYAVAHKPYAERSCDDCHEPASKGWTISRAENELCAECHEEQFDHPYLHGAISRGSCTGCHEPHAAPFAYVLNQSNPELCFKCHEKSRFAREVIHEPVSDGDCGACHDVHGAPRPNLLVKNYAQDRYQEYQVKEYELCFECHEEAPFADPQSRETTFRTAETNLHYLHVHGSQGEKSAKKPALGTTCRNCHEPHSTEQPVLIRKVLDCGGVPCLNLDFKRIPGMGRCSRGCHTPQIYSP